MSFHIRSLVLAVTCCVLHDSSLLANQASDPAPATIARTTFAPVPLVPRDQTKAEGDRLTAPTTRSSTAPLITVGSSLAIVLGLFAALVWVSRKASKNSIGNRELPDDALRIVGKKSLGPSGSIALVRCGRTVLIIGIHTSGMQRLGEITNDDEVRHLEALCDGRSKASFDETLAEMQREPIKRGFIGEEIHRPQATAGRKLFGAG